MIVFHSIQIKQFRAYEDVSVNFRADKGVILMYGDNGSGKSTLLNAINWCLYGDTPFYTTTEVRAILNKHAPEGAIAQVVIIASIGDSKYRFCRKTASDDAPSGALEVSTKATGIGRCLTEPTDRTPCEEYCRKTFVTSSFSTANA